MSDVVHQAAALASVNLGLGVVDTTADLIQRRFIQNKGSRIPDLPHYHSRATKSGADALIALTVCGLARTWQRRQRTLHHPDHRAYRDLTGSQRQGITTTLPFPAFDEPFPFQREEDVLQKVLGN